MQNVTSPHNDEAGIENAIQDKGLNAPRLTPALIDGVIANSHYFTAREGCEGAGLGGGVYHESLGLLTFCVLVLKNGFTVTGESACASPENFDAQIGCDIAYKNAREKIWLLEGYLLKEILFQSV